MTKAIEFPVSNDWPLCKIQLLFSGTIRSTLQTIIDFWQYMLQQQFFLKKKEKWKTNYLFSVVLYIIVILRDLSTFQQ